MELEIIDIRKKYTILENVLDTNMKEDFDQLAENIFECDYSPEEAGSITHSLGVLEDKYNSILSKIKSDLDAGLIEGVIENERYYPDAEFIGESFYEVNSSYNCNLNEKYFTKERGKKSIFSPMAPLLLAPGFLGFRGGALFSYALQEGLSKFGIDPMKDNYSYEDKPAIYFMLGIPFAGAAVGLVGTTVGLSMINPLLGAAYVGGVIGSYNALEGPTNRARKKIDDDVTHLHLNKLTNEVYYPLNEIFEKYLDKE